MADPSWFAGFQHDGESFVLGRLVQSRQDGPMSYGGLLGRGIMAGQSSADIGRQYDWYRTGASFADFDPYLSHPGVQGLLFFGLESVLPQPPEERYRLYQDLTALLSAAALTLVILWLGLEHGPVVAIVVLASTLASEWLTVFGRNLYWSIWGFYAPLAVCLFWFRRASTRSRNQPFAFGAVIFTAVVAKALLTGYEYMVTFVIMILAPVVFYGWRDQWGWRKTLVWLTTGGVACVLAALAVAMLLMVQIGAVRGNLQSGFDHIGYVLAKRTYGDPSDFPEIYRESLRAPVGEVLLMYLRGRYFDVNRYLSSPSRFVTLYVFKIRYVYLLALFFLASVLAWFSGRWRGRDAAPRRALVIATWFSLLAPLSWLVIFKAHSYIHTDMNVIVWQMPFTLFGFAVVGLAAEDLLAFLQRRLRSRGSGALAAGRIRSSD